MPSRRCAAALRRRSRRSSRRSGFRRSRPRRSRSRRSGYDSRDMPDRDRAADVARRRPRPRGGHLGPRRRRRARRGRLHGRRRGDPRPPAAPGERRLPPDGRDRRPGLRGRVAVSDPERLRRARHAGTGSTANAGSTSSDCRTSSTRPPLADGTTPAGPSLVARGAAERRRARATRSSSRSAPRSSTACGKRSTGSRTRPCSAALADGIRAEGARPRIVRVRTLSGRRLHRPRRRAPVRLGDRRSASSRRAPP